MHFIDEFTGKDAPQETIVCLHGNPTWSFFYRDLVKAFREEHRVVVPDHLGMGLSEKPQNYSYHLKDHIDNFEALVKSLNLEPFTLVVHDWGGAIGMGYAVRHPEMIKRILFMNTAAYPSQHMPKTIALARLPFLGAFLVRALNAFVWGAILTSTKRPLGGCVASGLRYPYDNWHNRVGVLRFVQDIPMDPSHPSYAELQAIAEGLPKLASLPKAFVWGGLDHVFNDYFLEDWKKLYPDAQYQRLDDVGHYVMEEAAEKVIISLRRLLEQ